MRIQTDINRTRRAAKEMCPVCKHSGNEFPTLRHLRRDDCEALGVWMANLDAMEQIVRNEIAEEVRRAGSRAQFRCTRCGEVPKVGTEVVVVSEGDTGYEHVCRECFCTEDANFPWKYMLQVDVVEGGLRVRFQEGLRPGAEIDAMAERGEVARPFKVFDGVELRGLLADFVEHVGVEERGFPRDGQASFDVHVVGRASCARTNMPGREVAYQGEFIVTGPRPGLTVRQTAVLGAVQALLRHELCEEGVRVGARALDLFAGRLEGINLLRHGSVVAGKE